MKGFAFAKKATSPNSPKHSRTNSTGSLVNVSSRNSSNPNISSTTSQPLPLGLSPNAAAASALMSSFVKNISEMLRDQDRFYGLCNFGNTCYCNSVVQALFFCIPFREYLLEKDDSIPTVQPSSSTTTTTIEEPNQKKGNHQRSLTLPSYFSIFGGGGIGSGKSSSGGPKSASAALPNTLFDGDATAAADCDKNVTECLRNVYRKILQERKSFGSIAPRQFIQQLRKENEIFRSTQQQDAQEFLNYLLNYISDDLKAKGQNNWVESVFQGSLSNQTKCLCCENISQRDEPFLDLSLEIEQNCSISHCLEIFSASELLCHKNKFFCDHCGCLQEAEKSLKLKNLPRVLILHLKRFKYTEFGGGQMKKLSFRVSFPNELRLSNTCDETKDPEKLYDLFAVVVHLGAGLAHGHYIALVKYQEYWICFDDDIVEPVSTSHMEHIFGLASAEAMSRSSSETAYMLFYQEAE